MSIAHWIGARAAEVATFFRDKPVVPCQVDWDNQLPDSFFDTLEDDGCIGPRGCEDDRNYCCLTTDTIAEFREWNQRG